MSTTSMNISLPEALKEYVKERVAEEHYSNPSDYIRALIREDQKRQAERKLERLLVEGLGSGDPVALTPEDWQAIRREVRPHVTRKRQRPGA